jgi:hypothetical protein
VVARNAYRVQIIISTSGRELAHVNQDGKYCAHVVVVPRMAQKLTPLLPGTPVERSQAAACLATLSLARAQALVAPSPTVLRSVRAPTLLKKRSQPRVPKSWTPRKIIMRSLSVYGVGGEEPFPGALISG